MKTKTEQLKEAKRLIAAMRAKKEGKKNPAGYFIEGGRYFYQDAPGEPMQEIAKEQFLQETKNVPVIEWR